MTATMRRCSCKLLVVLLLMTTITSSFVVRPPSHVSERQRRRHSIVNVRRGVAVGGRTPSVVSAPSSRRLVVGTSSTFPVFQNEVRDVQRTLPGDARQFPTKRRWNSGNLRVWGKRTTVPSPAAYIGDQLYGQNNDDNWVDGWPIWLLLAIDNGQAPAWVKSHKAVMSRISGEPSESARSQQSVSSNGQRESMNRRDMRNVGR